MPAASLYLSLPTKPHASGPRTPSLITTAMDRSDPEAHGHSDPPPRYDSGVEYLSEDELSENDVNVLNTDYNFQRDLTFCPAQHPQQYNPSIPQHLRQRSSSTDGVYNLPEKYGANTHEWEGRTPLPPRHSSLRKQNMYSAHPRTSDYRTPRYNTHAYQTHRQRVPLVDLIRNEWKHTTNPYASSPLSPGYATPDWIQVLSAPRLKRIWYLIGALLILTWANWHWWLGPQYTEHRLLSASLEDRMKTGEGWYGENMRPEFLDMVQVKTLDQRLVPQNHDRNRLIVIGDVHGCHDERGYLLDSTDSNNYANNMLTRHVAVVNLLSEVQYEARTDHLIFAGDFISKGPDSSAVIDLAMSARASCVRGNHEDRVLLAYRDIYSHRMTEEQQQYKEKKLPLPPAPGMPEDMQQNEDETPNLVEEAFEHGNAVDRDLARSLTKRQIDWMTACPVILDLGQIRGMGDVHVVHGGLVPGVRLEKQDPMGVMHMRTIDLDSHVPSSSTWGISWFKVRGTFWLPLPTDS